MIVEDGCRTASAEGLWTHIFEGSCGFLQVFTGERVPGGRLKDTTSRYFLFPKNGREAARWAIGESNREREAYFCAHLLTNKRRVKENAAPLRALYVDGDGAYPGDKLPQPTAVVESSPGRLQMWWRLYSEVPPEIGEDLNRRLAYAIGADKSGWDLTQLLRVPGTKNHKYPERPTVRFIGADGESYSRADIDEALPPATKQTRNSHHTERAPDEPPVKLDAQGLRVFRGEAPKLKADGTGVVDRSATLMKIARVLFDAGANREALMAALRERDLSLYEKYSNNRDGGEVEYHRIVDKLEEEGRSTTVKWHSETSFEGVRETASSSGEIEGKRNQPDRLIEYALGSGAELFRDHLGTPHVLVDGEAVPLNSRSYNWLRGLLWTVEARSVSGEALKTAAGTLAAFAAASGKVRELHTRSAYFGSAVYYQLDNGRVIEVDREGWRRVEDPPVVFRSVPNLKPLPDPERGGSLDALEGFVNLKTDRDKRMMRAYVVTVPLPHVARPILQTTGVMGSGKTTAGRVVKRLLDPTAPETVRPDPRDFLQKASHSYITMLDNQNNLPEWMVDTLCRLVTGEADSKRSLYTDDEDFIYELRRAVLLNGINAPTERGDAQDRTLPVELDRIPDDQRRSEEEMWSEFHAEHGRLLGAVFDALAQTLRVRESLELSRRPRLADWGIYAAAAYEVFGWGSEQFLEDWGEVVRVQNQGTLDGSPVAQAILSFMENRSEWIGLANELYAKLEDEAEDLKINTKRDKTWPKSPNWLWRRIREVQPLLVAMGIKANTMGSRRKGTQIVLEKTSTSGDDPKGGSKRLTAATRAATGHSPQVSGLEDGGSRGSNSVHPSGALSPHQGDVGVDIGENDSEIPIPQELPTNAATAATEREECIHQTVPGVCVWCREWREDHGRLPIMEEDVDELEI